jgi:hypothetical protein
MMYDARCRPKKASTFSQPSCACSSIVPTPVNVVVQIIGDRIIDAKIGVAKEKLAPERFPGGSQVDQCAVSRYARDQSTDPAKRSTKG